MTAGKIILGQGDDSTRPWLRLAQSEDLDALRAWRNANKCRFYQQAPVTVEGQLKWFEGYLARPRDYLFMVMGAHEPVGCIGIRFTGDVWDIYNVIRGVESASSTGFMSVAFAMVIAFARGLQKAPVQVDVLADNPAVNWYLRNGCEVVARDAHSIRMVQRGHE
jgi:hypothetical protein